MFDIAVIGGGVAGLNAGLFAARLGRSTLVLVPDIPGGHLATIDRVEDFPGFLEGVPGYVLGPAIQEQAASAGAEFRMAEVQRLAATDGSWALATTDGEVQARAAIIAAGSRNRALGVPGEERLRGRGVSHCASCDGPLLRGRPVTIIGAGDSGLQEALTLAGFASEVLVLHRAQQPAAQEVYQRRVREQPNIRLRANTVVDEVLGEQAVSGVRVRNALTGGTEVLETAALFVYTGLVPNTAFLQDTVRLDEAGRIPTDVWMRTELLGLFAAGDVRSDSASQAITAAHRYL